MWRNLQFPFMWTDGVGGPAPFDPEDFERYHVGGNQHTHLGMIKHGVGGGNLGRFIEALRAGIRIWHSDPSVG